MAGLLNIQPRTWRFAGDLAAVAREAQQLANHVTHTLRSLAVLAVLDGRRVEALEFTAATPLRIAHKLGRTPRGWFVVRFVAASSGSLRESATVPPDDSQLTLTSDVDALVDVVVF